MPERGGVHSRSRWVTKLTRIRSKQRFLLIMSVFVGVTFALWALGYSGTNENPGKQQPRQVNNQQEVTQTQHVDIRQNSQKPQHLNDQQSIPQQINNQQDNTQSQQEVNQEIIAQPEQEVNQENTTQPQQSINQTNNTQPQQAVNKQNTTQLQQGVNQLNTRQPKQGVNQQNITQPQDVIQQNNTQLQQAVNQQNTEQHRQEVIQQNTKQSKQEVIQQNTTQAEQTVNHQNIAQPEQEVNPKNIAQPKQEVIQQNTTQPKQEVSEQNQPKQAVNQQNTTQPQRDEIQQNTTQPKQEVNQQNTTQPQRDEIQQNITQQQQQVNQQNTTQPQRYEIQQNITQQQQQVSQQNTTQPQRDVIQQNTTQPKQEVNQQNTTQPQRSEIHQNITQPQQEVNQQSTAQPQRDEIEQNITQHQQEVNQQNTTQPQKEVNQQNTTQTQQEVSQQSSKRPQQLIDQQNIEQSQKTTIKVTAQGEQQQQQTGQLEKDKTNVGQEMKGSEMRLPPPNMKPNNFIEKLPVLLDWNKLMGTSDVELVCKTRRCLIVYDHEERHKHQVMGILFYGTYFAGDGLPVPRQPGHIWSVLHEESPKNNDWLFNAKGAMELFNLTATFKRESHFQLTTMWLKSEDELLSTDYVVPLERKNALRREGLAPVVFVHSDCDTPSDRSHYVRLLQKHLNIDSYGKCEHNKDFPTANLTFDGNINPMTSTDFYKVIAKYKFAFAFENAVCDDYVTEKFWRPLTLGVIPIVHGSPRIKELAPTNHSIIDIRDFRSVQEVAEFIKYLDENDEEYKKYIAFKQTGITNPILKRILKERNSRPVNWISEVTGFRCFVCEKVYKMQELLSAGRAVPRWQGSHEHFGCPRPKLFDEEGRYVNDNVYWGGRQYSFSHYYLKSLQHHIGMRKDANFQDIQKYARDLEQYGIQHNIQPDV